MRIIIAFFLISGALSALQAQDKLVLRNGKTVTVNVQRTDATDVYYTYPGEVNVYQRSKSAVSYIQYENGRREICDDNLRGAQSRTTRSGSSGSRLAANDAIDWQDVTTTMSEARVRNMKKLGRISAVSRVSYKDAVNQLKKKAAAMGGTMILILDTPVDDYSDETTVVGVAYRDEALEYTPRSQSERSQSESPVNERNERRRRIARQMEAYNNETNIIVDEPRPSQSSVSRPQQQQPSRSTSRSSDASAPDAVYLIDGKVIRGTIEENEPEEFVSIRTTNGKVYELSMDDVKRVQYGSRATRATRDYEEERNNRYANRDRQQRIYADEPGFGGRVSGYKGIFDLGYNIAVGANGEKGSFDINTSHGYQINESLFVGAGLGLHIYNARDVSMKDTASFPQYVMTVSGTTGKPVPVDSLTWNHAIDSSYMTLPIFLDVRGYFPIRNSPVTPFAMLRVGYAFNLSDGFKGMGLYMNPAVGVKFSVADNFGINLSLGYAFQSYGGIPANGGYGYYYFKDRTGRSKKEMYEAKGAGSFSLKVGIEF